MAAGFGLMVAALVITLAVEVPIDNRIEAWTARPCRPIMPIQARWELFHTIRTISSIAAVVAATISATVAQPSGMASGSIYPEDAPAVLSLASSPGPCTAGDRPERMGNRHEISGGPTSATTDVLELVEPLAAAERGNGATALDGLLANAHIGMLQTAGPPSS